MVEYTDNDQNDHNRNRDPEDSDISVFAKQFKGFVSITCFQVGDVFFFYIRISNTDNEHSDILQQRPGLK